MSNIWFTEYQTDHLTIQIKVKEKLYSENTQFQKLDIYETFDYGRLLTLDDKVMLTEKDEFVYHEMISHIPLYSHPNPKKVLIIGGGDGGTLREVVKHECVEKADLCELDQVVVEKCKEYFNFFDNSWNLDKVEIHYKDGFDFLANKKDTYQVILVDSTDPVGEAEKLFDLPFFTLCHEALTEDGILTFQSESPFFNLPLIEKLKQILNPLFSIVKLYTASVPTYPSGYWSFMYCSNQHDPMKHFQLNRFHQDQLSLKYYNESIHSACFAHPNFVKDIMTV